MSDLATPTPTTAPPSPTTANPSPTTATPSSTAGATTTGGGRQQAHASARSQRRRARRSAITSWLAVLVIIALAVGAALQLVAWRAQADALLQLDEVQLSAQRFAVGSTGSATVETVDVEAGEAVAAGDELGSVTVEPADRSAGNRATTEVLTAPTDAIVISVDQPVGSIVRAGEAVLTLYEPDQLVFVATAPVELISQLRVGMSVELSGPGLAAATTATVQSARVPTAEPAGSDRLAVVLLPDDITTVAGLIPDLPFQGTVDLGSAPDNAPSVVSISP